MIIWDRDSQGYVVNLADTQASWLYPHVSLVVTQLPPGLRGTQVLHLRAEPKTQVKKLWLIAKYMTLTIASKWKHLAYNVNAVKTWQIIGLHNQTPQIKDIVLARLRHWTSVLLKQFRKSSLALNMQTHHSPTPGWEQEPAAKPSSFCWIKQKMNQLTNRYLLLKQKVSDMLIIWQVMKHLMSNWFI